MKIISGDLKGTRLISAMQETWGFDGSPNEGTIVTIKMTLQASGLFSLMGMFPDESILYSLDKSLADIVSYAEYNSDDHTVQQAKSDNDDKKESKSTLKKGHRQR